MNLLVTKNNLRWNGELHTFELNQEYIEYRFKIRYKVVLVPFIIPCLRADLNYNYWPVKILKRT